MIIEFQTATENILETLMLVLTEMLGGHIAQGPFKAGADALYLHTVRLAGPAVLQVAHEEVTIAVQGGAPKIQGQALFVEQPLTVVYGRVSGASLALEPPLSCRLKLRLRLLASGGNLEIRFDQGAMIAPAALPAPLVEAYGTLAAFIEGWLRMSTSIPLAPLAFSEAAPTVFNHGIAASADRSFIALRVEFGEVPATAAGWETFHNGQTPKRLTLEASSGSTPLPSSAWAHFVERTAVESAVKSFVGTGLAKSSDYKLDSPISTGWSFANGEARVNTSFTFRVPDACKCLAWDVDLVGDYDLSIAFVVENENEVTLKGNYGVKITSDAAKDCCTVTLTVAWPFLGDDDLGKLKMNRLEWFIGLMQGPLILGIGLNARFGNRQLSADSLGGTCETTEEWKFTCRRDFKFGGQASDIMKLTGLVGQGDGLVLLGSQLALGGAGGLPPVRAPQFKGVPTTFAWHVVHPTCSNAGPLGLAARNASPFAFFYGLATIAISNPANDAPGLPIVPKLLVHEARVIADPLKVFAIGKLTGGPDNYNLDVRCGYPSVGYRAAPYPCTVLLQTSAGLAVVSVAIPPELNKTEEQARAEAEAAFWEAVNQCSAISDPFASLKVKTVWLVDPPPPWIRAKERRKWALFPEGRRAGFEVHVLDRSENVLARAMAPTRGLVELGFMNNEDELTLEVVSGGAPDARPREQPLDREQQLALLSGQASSRVKVVQTSLTETATIDVSGGVVQLLSAPTNGGRGLVVVQQNRMSVYDVTTPSAPVLVDEFQGEGFAGATHAEDGSMLAWGAGGLQRLSLDRGRFKEPEQISNAHTSALIRVDRGWAALSGDRVEFRGADLTVYEQMELPARGTARLFPARQQAMLVYGDGLATSARGGTGRWQSAGRVEATVDWSRSARVDFGGRPMVFAPEDLGSGGFVVDLESASRPLVVAWYREAPWFVQALTIGDLTATIGNGGVSLYQTRQERVL